MTTQTRATSPSGPWLARRSYVLFMTILLYVVAYVDRGILATIAEPVKAEFGLSDGAMGTLMGLVFTVPMALALIPAGYLSDRADRRNILVFVVSVWSALTIASGFATHIIQLIVLRALIAVAEAFFYTTAPPIVAGHYDQIGRAQALSRLHVAVGFASLVGVPLVAAASQAFGWRAGFIVSGVPGLLFAAIYGFTVGDPRSKSRAQTPSEGLAAGAGAIRTGEIVQIVKVQKSLSFFMLGNVMSAIVFAGCVAWMMPFLMRVHELSLTQGGYAVSLSIGGAGVLGYYFGGSIASRLAERDTRWLGLLPMSVSVVSLAMLLTAACTVSIALWFVTITIWSLANAIVTGPAMGLLYSLTPTAAHGRIAAVNSLLLSVVGAGMGPLVVGAISGVSLDAYGADSLRFAFAAVTPLLVCAVFFYWRAARTVAQDLERAAGSFASVSRSRVTASLPGLED